MLPQPEEIKERGKDRANTDPSRERSGGRHVWALGSPPGHNRNCVVRRSTPTPSARLRIQEPTSADETALQ